MTTPEVFAPATITIRVTIAGHQALLPGAITGHACESRMARKRDKAVTTATGSPQKAAIDQGAREAYAAEGFVTDAGIRDTTRVREHVFEVLRPHKVLTWGEREDKAITRGAVTAQVFPGLPGPDTFSDQEDPQLARAVWVKVSSEVWSQLQPGAAGPVQQLVGRNMGNGYVLCRTKIGADSTDAVYITDNRQCIERDYLTPDNARLQRLFEATSDNRAMLIARQPANARRFAQGYDSRVKALGSAAHDKLHLAVEASVNGTEPETEPES